MNNLIWTLFTQSVIFRDSDKFWILSQVGKRRRRFRLYSIVTFQRGNSPIESSFDFCRKENGSHLQSMAVCVAIVWDQIRLIERQASRFTMTLHHESSPEGESRKTSTWQRPSYILVFFSVLVMWEQFGKLTVIDITLFPHLDASFGSVVVVQHRPGWRRWQRFGWFYFFVVIVTAEEK